MSEPNPRKTMVRVFLNNRPMHVPQRVDGHYAVRGWLGIARGHSVALENRPHDLLVFEKGHDFHQDERYVTEDGSYLFTEHGLSDANQGDAAPEEKEPPEQQWSGRLSNLN